jgi:membrane protease YdiL (CAAX protease family)
MNRRAATRASLQEPYFLLLIFVALGLGTLTVKQPVRLALLWTSLALLSVVYRSGRKIEMGFDLVSIGRGLLLGLVIAMPLLAFLSKPLREFNETLYATTDVAYLYYQACLVSVPVEEYFFRGIIQQSKGLWPAIGLYGGALLLLFLPHTPPLVALLVVATMGALGLAYAFVASKHGLAAAIACRLVVALLVQVFPSFFVVLRMLFA